MYKSFTLQIFLLAVLLTTQSQIHAQCTPSAPPEGNCSGGNGAAYNGVNINNGETYWYTATGSFSNGSNINNGGTLRICGNLTLNQINLNGGTIIVKSGGSLTINGSGTLNLDNNVTIVNYGILTINRDVVLQNSNNAIINASATSVINMQGYKLTVSGSNTSSNNILINKGTVNLGTLEITSNSNGVCLGNQSVIETNHYINGKTNAITVEPGAIAAFSFKNTGQNNAPLTATSSLRVCKASGATFSGSSTIGAAVLYENCTSASAVLPITLTNFYAQSGNKEVTLYWETAQEINNDYFILQHSIDGIQFESKSEKIAGAGNSDIATYYKWTDAAPAVGINYYRLKQVDTDGTIHYHGIRSAIIEGKNLQCVLYPNPADQWLTVTFDETSETTTTIVVLDIMGRTLQTLVANEGQNQVRLDLSKIPGGNYELLVTNDRQVQILKFVKR